jgi:antitoxin component of MazEF toxin-antitoxin module
MQPRLSLPLVGRPKGRRLIARVSVRIRREGGSLSMTIPRYIVRHWNLEPGSRLVIRSTDEGVLLYPRYFLPYVDAPWLQTAAAGDEGAEYAEGEADEPEDGYPAADKAARRPAAVSVEEAPTATAG